MSWELVFDLLPTSYVFDDGYGYDTKHLGSWV